MRWTPCPIVGYWLIASVALNGGCALHSPAQTAAAACGPSGGTPYVRTELYFGLAKPDGSEVSAAEFQSFVDQDISPRFPKGLTVLDGAGHYRNGRGERIEEGTKILVLLYPPSAADSLAVERIRAAYRARFQQESVLRADGQACVSY